MQPGNLNTAREFHTATLLPNGKVLVAGGIGSSGPLSSAELYDPASGMWTATGSLSYRTPGSSHGDVAAQRQGAGGEEGPAAARSAELYDPASEMWSCHAPASTPHALVHMATLLPNGQVLVAGDSNGRLS